MNADIITLQGKRLAVLPLDLWESIIEKLEDFDDIMAAREIEASPEAEYFPIELMDKIKLEGKNPVKVFREYRKMTQEQLAEKAGISVHMVRKIENGESEGSISTIKAIAKALNEDVEMFL